MTRAVIYARYSSDLQTDASIEDQIRIGKDRAKRENWDSCRALCRSRH
jgi:site-specific DNA recombinase